ncbi:MAG: hypothetical protein M3R50_08125 [Bacteroidota bacterium]|nr:hypothetical protein [Bacteroidota bacterium]
MIVFGRKAKKIASERLSEQCPGCNTQSVDMYLFQEYGHVFWIPFLPVGRLGMSQCSKCGQVLKTKQIPANFVAEYEKLKKKTKVPFWTFSGLALVGIIIIASIIYGQKKDELNAKLITAPQKGDVFEMKLQSKKYTLFKVERVSGDTVYVNPSNYETDRATGINDIKSKGDSAYSKDDIVFSKAELAQMLSSGEITGIDR